MSLKRYFAWTRKTQFIQADPTSLIKFVPKEAAPPRHLSDEEEEALVAAVNAVGTLRDQAIITLLTPYRTAGTRTLYFDAPADPLGQAKRDAADYREMQESA